MEPPVHVSQAFAVDTDLHEAGPDTGTVDPRCPFVCPAGGELIGRFGVGVWRQELPVPGAVVSGVGEDVNARGVGQPPQEPRISPEIRRRAFDQGLAAELAELFDVRQDGAEDLVGIVPVGAHVGCANEIDQHMLVWKRRPHLLRRDGSVDGHDGRYRS